MSVWKSPVFYFGILLLAVVGALAPSDFYKSMTTHADHTVWQDVYRPAHRRATCTSS